MRFPGFVFFVFLIVTAFIFVFFEQNPAFKLQLNWAFVIIFPVLFP